MHAASKMPCGGVSLSAVDTGSRLENGVWQANAHNVHNCEKIQ